DVRLLSACGMQRIADGQPDLDSVRVEGDLAQLLDAVRPRTPVDQTELLQQVIGPGVKLVLAYRLGVSVLFGAWGTREPDKSGRRHRSALYRKDSGIQTMTTVTDVNVGVAVITVHLTFCKQGGKERRQGRRKRRSRRGVPRMEEYQWNAPYQAVERALASLYGADDATRRGAFRARLDN